MKIIRSLVLVLALGSIAGCASPRLEIEVSRPITASTHPGVDTTATVRVVFEGKR